MLSQSISSIQSLISSEQIRIEEFGEKIKDNLSELCFDASLSDLEFDYVDKLYDLSDTLMIILPSEIEILKTEFDLIIPATTMKNKAKKGFRDKVLAALGYSSRRSDFYPEYFRKMNIKACVYCNSQHTVAVDAEDKSKSGRIEIVAKFQVDHHLPKSHYPCFSVSLFNLIPVCASCNNCKSVSEIEFPFYVDVITPSAFKFFIELTSRSQYLLTRDINDIKLSFKEPSVVPPKKSFKELFDVSGIYETQKDLAEELVLKAEIYSPEYKKNLVRDFPKIFTDTKISNRLILGNYADEEDLHKRPMAKFIQDLAKDLGLI